MTKKMTVVFHDDELYTDLKIAAVKHRRPASEIVAEAVREWLEVKEEEALLPVIRAGIADYEKNGGVPWEQVRRELDEARANRKRAQATN